MDISYFISRLLPVLAFFTLIGWLAWLWFQRQQMRTQSLLRVRMALYNGLIARLSTAKDFVLFLESEQGCELMNDLTNERRVVHEPIFRSLRRGIILLCVGVAMMAVGYLMGPAHYVVVNWGGVAVGFGIGYLVSARASAMLARRWGLVPSVETAKPSQE